MDRQSDVIVVGGGLHGLSAALQLAKRGTKVTVLEKDYSGRHASGVNAGGVRRLGRHEAEIPLSVAAMQLWHGIESMLDDDCGFSACGQIKVAETSEELAAMTSRVQRLQSMGFQHEELLDAQTLREVAPAVADHCTGAIICRDDGAANPFRTVTAMKRKVVDAGVQLLEGTAVRDVLRDINHWRVKTDTNEYQATHLVNAAGAWSGWLAAHMGESVPLKPQALMLMISERCEPFVSQVLGAQGRALSFKQFDNGTVLIGGGHKGVADLDSNRSTTRLNGLQLSAQTVMALFPQLRSLQINRFWAGIEACLPDDIPVLGQSVQEETLWHSFGYCGHGFQLSPITGHIIADLIIDGKTDFPIDPFSIGRFCRTA